MASFEPALHSNAQIRQEMTTQYRSPNEFELDERTFINASDDSFDLDREDYEGQSLTRNEFQKYPKAPTGLAWWTSSFSRRLGEVLGHGLRPSKSKRSHLLQRQRNRRVGFLLHAFAIAISALVILTGIFRPSYTRLPPQYQELRQLTQSSDVDGRANARNEKIFIAASIFDPKGDLAKGAWGESVRQLIQILGRKNVFLSIYENDAGDVAQEALDAFRPTIPCDYDIVFQPHLDSTSIGTVTVAGEERIDRIAYLAETRNRALRPLDLSRTKYDKVLYLNDVMFDPVEAVQLLFATGATSDGHTTYRAACAVDFINPFKFYDTFATRDLEGYSMGIPFYPWFTDSGQSVSRRDVLDQKDTVRVRSCWGGMVAFDAKYLQVSPGRLDELNVAGRNLAESENFRGFRFRAEEDTYWSASECCLIHADIQSPEPDHEGIYMNPYVRVAYDSTTLSWLRFTRRFERLYSPIHNLCNHLVGLPWFNPRRDEVPGTIVTEKVWVWDIFSPVGSFEMVERNASHTGFCGTRQLQVMKKHKKPGQKPWEHLPIPS